MVLVLPSILALLGDNPMQSEFACHAGLQAKFFCHSCWVKGKDSEDHKETGQTKTETFEGMVNQVQRFMKVVHVVHLLLILNHTLAQIGEPRIPSQTQSLSKQMLDNVIQIAPQKANQALRTSSGIKDKFPHGFFEKIE